MFCVLLASLVSQCTADSFKNMKEQLAAAECVRFEFVSIIESDIFDQTDSCSGAAYIARDGRYRVKLGPDIYLYEGRFLYSYSEETNQVIIEKPDSGSAGSGTSDEISFIADLDEFYETYTVTPDIKYRLMRKGNRSANIPDSMIVFIDANASRISRFEYFDINGERNRILFLRQRMDSTCTSQVFEPVFPDSAERVKLF